MLDVHPPPSPTLSRKAIAPGVWDAAERRGLINLTRRGQPHLGDVGFLKVMGDQGLHTYEAFDEAARFDIADGNPTHRTAEQLFPAFRSCPTPPVAR